MIHQHSKENEKITHRLEKTFVNHISEKAQISRMYAKLLIC